MKDLDSISTIHLKLPFREHMAIKVEAMKAGKSMNQFIVDLLGSYRYVGGEFNAVNRPPAPQVKSGSPGVFYNSTPSIPQPTPVKENKFPPSAASML